MGYLDGVKLTLFVTHHRLKKAGSAPLAFSWTSLESWFLQYPATFKYKMRAYILDWLVWESALASDNTAYATTRVTVTVCSTFPIITHHTSWRDNLVSVEHQDFSTSHARAYKSALIFGYREVHAYWNRI